MGSRESGVGSQGGESETGSEESGKKPRTPSSRLTPDYLILGHVTQDRFEQKFILGGSATYSALAARNLGEQVGVLTSAAFEPGLVDVLYGIQVARQPAEQTTRFVNLYEKDVRHQYVEASAEPLDPEMLLPEWRSAPLVHLAPIANELRPEAVEAFPNALIGVTPQGWMRAWDESGLVRAIRWEGAETVLARADAVILSEQDVVEPDEIERYTKLAKLMVVTRQHRGCSVWHAGEWRHFAAFRSRQVDPTGAGDVFAAAYLVYLKESGDPYRSAEFANCVASFVIEKRYFNGIPTLEQVQERWQAGRRRKEIGPG
jgi:1D-myo-inositol 3-kinase